jgi:DNA modification methylase
MTRIDSQCIDLVITSPPYPIIDIWNDSFSKVNPEIKKALKDNNGVLAFELMHKELDKVWREVYRVLKNGGILCVNIGDAVQTFDNNFQLYSNHSRILSSCLKLGFSCLPGIIWRKPTNAPNKFMGSGMLPPTAYVTLEHEFILIMRKGRKRDFKEKSGKQIRRESCYFWEERNNWFSDLWDLKGESQLLEKSKTRDRSAAYPFELAYRIINMFSIKGDLILDPFLGTGTTTIAAMAAGRNSVGYEIDYNLKEEIYNRFDNIVSISNDRIKRRLRKHREFVQNRLGRGKEIKHMNRFYDFPVVTKQETDLYLNELEKINKLDSHSYEITYNT